MHAPNSSQPGASDAGAERGPGGLRSDQLPQWGASNWLRCSDFLKREWFLVLSIWGEILSSA